MCVWLILKMKQASSFPLFLLWKLGNVVYSIMHWCSQCSMPQANVCYLCILLCSTCLPAEDSAWIVDFIMISWTENELVEINLTEENTMPTTQMRACCYKTRVCYFGLSLSFVVTIYDLQVYKSGPLFLSSKGEFSSSFGL